MKIVHVIDQLGLGGAERVCVNMVNLLHRNKQDVKLILFDAKGALQDSLDEGVQVSTLQKKKGKVQAYKKFVKEVRTADVIHVHMRQNYRFAQKAFLMFGGRKKIIFHDHYGRIIKNKRVPFFMKGYFRPDVFIGCSRLLTDWAETKVKMEKEKVYMINNFVIKYPSKPFPQAEKKGLVMVGNLKVVKNHAFAIRLAKKLNESVTIYCSGTTGEYYEELSRLIEELEYIEKVRFITGCHNVQAELKQYKLAVLTSISEGDPLVVMEYLAQGLPCICSDVGESVKVIRKYYPFLVQDEYDLEEWKSAYDQAVLIPTESIEQIYDQHFTEQLYLKKYLDVYQKSMH